MEFRIAALRTLIGTAAMLGTFAARETAADAQTLPAPPYSFAPDGGRTIAGHTFQLPTLFDSAFVTSDFAVQTGGSFARLTDVPFDGRTATADVVGANTSLQLDLALSRHLGLFASVSGAVFAGSDVKSAVLEGLDSTAEGRAGFITTVFRSRASGTEVGLRSWLQFELGSTVRPLNLVNAILATPGQTIVAVVEGPAGRVMKSTNYAYGTAIEFAWAQALGRHASFQTAVGGVYEHTKVTTYDIAANTNLGLATDRADLLVGAALTLDGAPRTPIAAQGEYRFVVPAIHSSTDPVVPTTHTVVGGLYYSGRRDLQLGGTVGVMLFTGETNYLAELTMRYFF